MVMVEVVVTGCGVGDEIWFSKKTQRDRQANRQRDRGNER